MSFEEKAKSLHDCGQNCAQAVLGCCCEQLKLDPETASRLAAFLGGGMRRGEICGAVSGTLLALGMEYGDENNRQCMKSQEFLKTFEQKYGSLRCRELIGIDGLKKKEQCPILIDFCAKYLEEELK